MAVLKQPFEAIEHLQNHDKWNMLDWFSWIFFGLKECIGLALITFRTDLGWSDKTFEDPNQNLPCSWTLRIRYVQKKYIPRGITISSQCNSPGNSITNCMYDAKWWDCSQLVFSSSHHHFHPFAKCCSGVSTHITIHQKSVSIICDSSSPAFHFCAYAVGGGQ